MGTEIENDLLLFEEDEPVKPEVTNYEADLSIFDDIETENKQIQQEIVASNIQDAPDNLDLYNEIQSIAERTGYDTDMISENLSTMRKQVQLQDLDFPKFQTEYPQTASFLSDRRNSLLTADNVDNLAYHEKLLGDSKRRIDMSRRNSEMIPYIKKIGGGEATAEDYAELEKLEGMNYQDSQVDYDLGWFSEVIPISAEFGDQMIRLAPISIAGAAVGAGVGATAGFFSPVPGGAAIGARTGARIGASAGMGTEIAEMEGWLAYNDYRKMTDEYGVPVSDGYAKGSAIIVGIANGGIELVKVEALISMFPGAKKILGSLVESVGKGKKDKLADAMNIPGLRTVIESVGKLGLIAAISGGEEAAQELVTSTGKDVVALGSESYVRTDTMSEKMTAAGEAFSVGARGGAGLGTVPVIGSHVMHNKKVRYTQARAGKIGELMGIAQDSKLRQRDPATYKKHINDISSQDGERKEVYIAPEKVEELFQSIDPVILEEQMPGILERIDVAHELGQDVSIPLEEFMAYVAPADEAMPYIGDFKFGRDEMTLNEVGQESAKLAKIDESMKQYTDLLQSEEVAMQSAQDRQVYEAIKDKLLATGESDTVASYQAEVINAFAVARAQEFKNDPNMPDISPYDLAFGDTTLNIQREGIEQPKGETREEGILNLLREGGPTDKEIFGQSLNEFLAQKGLDVTSDLEAMDAGKTKYGGRRLMRKGGMSIDEAIDMSIAQGYFPDAGGTMHPTDFMEAVWDGENVYAAGAEDQSLLDIRNEIEALESEMDIEGLDWMNMTNAEVIEKMPSLQQSELYQSQGEKRGSMRSGESKKWFTITLGGKADYSTFLHEGMHFTVAMMDKLAAMENVPQSIIDENNKMRAWAGAKPGEKMTVAQEEKLAEAFEKYLKEGKAPSAKLKEAFRRFSMWLTQIYKTLKESDVVLDDEIRGVFDRLLATQEEITAAKEADNLIPMFESAADMGVSDKAFAAYVESWNGAERAGKEEIDRKVLEEYYLTKTSEYKKKRQAVKKKIELELSKNKHWNALSFIRRGKFLGTRINDSEFSSTRLNSAEMKSDYVGTDNAKRLSRLKLTSPKGIPAQRLADYLGYESADALVQQMLSLPKYEDELNYRTDIAMKEKYGDVLQDTPEIASEAMNNDEAGYALAVELAALSKLDVNVEKRGHFQEMRALKAHAERIISEHKFTQLRPGQYRTAEVRMSSASAKAKAEGKDKEAAEYKRKQIMNHYLYMETNRAKVEISKIRDHLARYQKVTVRDKVGKVQGEYLEQIMSLLERVNLRKSETGKSIEKKKSLAAWLDEQEAADNVVNVPESIRNAVELTSYKDMTFSELIALDDAVSSIENIVRTKDRIMVAQQKRKLEEVLDEITNNADNHLKQRKGHKYVNMPTTPEKLSDAVENAAAEGVKMEQIALWIDGGKHGIAYDTLYDPLNVAMYNELEMKRDVGKKVQKLMLAIPAEQRRRLNNGIYKFQGGITVKGIDILSVALNWGNLSNRKKLIEGYRAEGWTEEHVFAILDKTLEKEDWAFVQGVWNELGVIGDEGLALARKTQGKAPPKIKAEKFVTRHGVIDGGYYPIAYDPNAKNNGYKADQFKKEGDLFAENFLRVGISHGFAEGRAEDYSAPIRLSLSVMNKHIDDVIHYITHYEAITGINKVISNRRFERMIKDKFGTKHYQALQEILNNVATNSDNLTGASFLSNDTLKWMRGTITATTFGFNLSSTAMQTLGLIPAMTKVKPHYLAGSLLKYATLAGAPKEWKFANDNSKILKHSITTWDQNVYAVMESSMDDASRNLLKKLGKHGQRYMFTFVGGMQRAVSGATWTAKYKEEMNEHNDHDAAVKAADSIVTTTQGGGSPKDLSPIQIGDGYKKQFTSFMGYFMVQALMLREVYRRQAGKNITEKNRITMIPETVAKTALILSIPTLVEMIMRGETPDDFGDEDDRNDWLRQYGINNILLALNVPLVGSMASYVLDGKYGYTYNPTSSTLERLGREFKTVFGEDKEFDERAYSLAVLVGFRYKLPTTELKRLYKVWEKYQDEGELDDTARELIFGINYD